MILQIGTCPTTKLSIADVTGPWPFATIPLDISPQEPNKRLSAELYLSNSKDGGHLDSRCSASMQTSSRLAVSFVTYVSFSTQDYGPPCARQIYSKHRICRYFPIWQASHILYLAISRQHLSRTIATLYGHLHKMVLGYCFSSTLLLLYSLVFTTDKAPDVD
jgi:hypothetical protein